MRNIRLVIEYDGSRYCGWQKGKGKGDSICEKLEGVCEDWCLKTVWGVGYKFEIKE